jgi:hypothetical protein
MRKSSLALFVVGLCAVFPVNIPTARPVVADEATVSRDSAAADSSPRLGRHSRFTLCPSNPWKWAGRPLPSGLAATAKHISHYNASPNGPLPSADLADPPKERQLTGGQYLGFETYLYQDHRGFQSGSARNLMEDSHVN